MNPGAEWSVGNFSCSVDGEDLQDADAGLAGYQIVAPAGSTVVCSIENTKVPPSFSKITLTKNVFGTTEPWSFGFTLNGGDPRTATNAAPVVSWDQLTPNATYTLAEVNPGADWIVGDFVCSVGEEELVDADPALAGYQIVAPAGSNVVCSLDNTKTPPAPGKITLTKNVAGAVEAWSFMFQLNGANDRTVTNEAPVATWDNLTPNQMYTLSEVDPGADWEVGAISCLVNSEPVSDSDPDAAGFQVDVTPGAVVACNITNTLKPGTITLTKLVKGTTEPWSFTFQLNGEDDRTVNNAAPVATWNDLASNQVYTLSEVNPGVGWQVGAISCLVNNEPVSDVDPNAAGFQVNVTPGAAVACSLTNTLKPGKITMTKSVIGTTEPWSFTFQLNGGMTGRRRTPHRWLHGTISHRVRSTRCPRWTLVRAGRPVRSIVW
ncbi:MAG: hypothetical protein IPK16_25825 [Anaerolineales bacterium]|nr:hypothetical protein [Anaerolineales bacterium]